MDDNYFKAVGDRERVLRRLAEYLQVPKEDAERLLSFLETTPVDLPQGEYFAIERPSEKNLMPFQGRYYVSLSKLCIVVLVQILDRTITGGLVGTLLSVAGKPEPALFPLSRNDGETCILKEIIRKDSRHDSHVLDEAKGLCYNCHLPCKYRSEERCTCSVEQAQEILDRLVSRGILRKTADGEYCLC